MLPRSVWASMAILLAGLLLLDYTSQAEVTVEREALSRFPTQVLGREAVEQPLSAPILRELGLTDYLSRTYWAEGSLPVDLYIGFYESQRTGATYHSPKNCLPGNGWQMIETETVDLPGPSGPATVNEIVIQKSTDKQVVVYWYHDRGRVVVSEYMAKLYMVWDAATRHRTDGALVRVIVPVERGDEAGAKSVAREFAAKVMGDLSDYLPG